MIRLQWNGLRPGDHVDVHDDDDSGMSIISGTVETVQTPAAATTSRSGSRPRAGRAVVRPRRLAVHLHPIDPA